VRRAPWTLRFTTANSSHYCYYLSLIEKAALVATVIVAVYTFYPCWTHAAPSCPTEISSLSDQSLSSCCRGVSSPGGIGRHFVVQTGQTRDRTAGGGRGGVRRNLRRSGRYNG